MGEAIEKMTSGEVAAEAVRCLRCGYDLRGNTGERCSECGWVIDRAMLRGAGFAWARRRLAGWIRSYWKTVWQVSVDSRRVREEAGRAQDVGDAKRFAWVTGCLVAAVLVGISALLISQEGLWRLAVRTQSPFGRGSQWPAWMENLAVPWSAGATLLWVIPAMLLLYGFFLTSAQRRLFRLSNAESGAAQRAEAIGEYAIAPLAWLVPVTVLFAGMRLLLWEDGRVSGALMIFAIAVALSGILVRATHAAMRRRANILFMPMMLLAGALIFVLASYLQELQELEVLDASALHVGWIAATGVVLLLTIARVVQWSARVRQTGLRRAFLDVPHLIGTWLLGAVAFFGVLPWCIGFIWIVIDSFR